MQGARCNPTRGRRSTRPRPIGQWWRAGDTRLKIPSLQTLLQLLPTYFHPKLSPSSLRRPARLFGLPSEFWAPPAIGQFPHSAASSISVETICYHAVSQDCLQNVIFVRGMCGPNCSSNVFLKCGRHCAQSSVQIVPRFQVHHLVPGVSCGF